MYIFFSTLKPFNFSEVEIKQNQDEYLEAFKSWKSLMDFDRNYLYLDNSLSSLSEIVSKELLDICWEVYDFGAVLSYIKIARAGYSIDPDMGSINLLKALLNDKHLVKKNYFIIVLGKRLCNENLKLEISDWIANGSSCGLYFKNISGDIFDDVFIIRNVKLSEAINVIESRKRIFKYSEAIEVLAHELNLECRLRDE